MGERPENDVVVPLINGEVLDKHGVGQEKEGEGLESDVAGPVKERVGPVNKGAEPNRMWSDGELTRDKCCEWFRSWLYALSS